MESRSITTVIANDNKCQITWSDGQVSHFHALWLRDNCPCPECLHPQTRERVLDIMDVPQDLMMPTTIKIEAQNLAITWQDGHLSEFNASWLKDHCYSEHALQSRKEKLNFWNEDIARSIPEIDYDAIMQEDSGLLQWLDMMVEYGFAIVRNTPTIHGEVCKLAAKISFLKETNFGREFEVISKANPNNVAYTAISLKSHSDLPNWELPPGVQFLHCLKSEATGGESTLVDGFAVAEILRLENPEAFELLKSQAIPFRFHDEEWDLSHEAPTIGCNASGDYTDIRYHAALTAPLQIPSDNVLPFYQAYRALTNIIRAPENILELKLMPGDVMVFNNKRVLHGRAAFDPTSGDRRLEGCYVDNDAILSKRRVLRRKLQD
ncbi:MAG: TauD/TfdA family dioxygenase [Sneathiella sp.]|nr:TauD/TfdA family dioxygenase [Sneathiella sp.]